MSSTAESTVDDDGARLNRVLPLIRSRPGRRSFSLRGRRDLVALGRDVLVVAKHKRGRDVPEECHAEGGLGSLVSLGLARPGDVIPLGSIRRVVAEPRSWLDDKVRFRVTSDGRVARFALPEYETPHLIRALGALLGDRFEARSKVRFRVKSTYLLLWAFFQVPFLMAASATLYLGNAPGAAIYAAAPIVVLAIVVTLDNITRRPRRAAGRPVPKGKDVSGRRPFRSRGLGVALKAAGLAWLLGLFLLHDPILARVYPAAIAPLATRPDRDQGEGLLYIASLFGLALLYVGYVLAQRNASQVRAGDPRRPIVYLRSFRDDGKNNLNPETTLSGILGISAPSWMNRWPRPWRFLFQLHPVRILRLALNRSVDTTEEQVGLYFRRFGPFVAIGEPGERFVTPGAARMYVSHETWQQTVLELLAEARMVVLQPAQTEGIWWEVRQTVTTVEPQRILMCMINFRGRQDDYESFRLRVEDAFRRPLPRSVGNVDAPTFLAFDRDGTAQLVTIGNRSPLLWPLLDCAVDLPASLGPIVEATDGDLKARPRPPRRYLGHGLAAVLLYSVVLSTIWTLGIGRLRNSVDAMVAPAEAPTRAVVVAPPPPPPPTATSPTTYGGRAFDYRITLGPGWSREPLNPTVDLLFRHGDADHPTELRVVAEARREDLEGFPEKMAKAVEKSTSSPVTITRRSTVDHRGASAIEFDLAMTVQGRDWVKNFRLIPEKESTFLLVATYPVDGSMGLDAIREVFGAFVPPPQPIEPPGPSTVEDRIVYTGIGMDYHVTLDRAWRRAATSEKEDLKFLAGANQALDVIVARAPEDLGRFSATYVEGMRKRQVETRILEEGRVELGGTAWGDLRVRARQEGSELEQHLRFRSGGDGTFLLIGSYPADDEAARRRADRALDSFRLDHPPAP